MTLGHLLRQMRESRGLSRLRAASESGMSSEHLRRLEVDSSRPSPEALSRLLRLYDLGRAQEDLAWTALAVSHIPEEVQEKVRVLPRSSSHASEADVIAAAMEWVELYYEPDGDDLKYLSAHIRAKLEKP